MNNEMTLRCIAWHSRLLISGTCLFAHLLLILLCSFTSTSHPRPCRLAAHVPLPAWDLHTLIHLPETAEQSSTPVKFLLISSSMKSFPILPSIGRGHFPLLISVSPSQGSTATFLTWQPSYLLLHLAFLLLKLLGHQDWVRLPPQFLCWMNRDAQCAFLECTKEFIEYEEARRKSGFS